MSIRLKLGEPVIVSMGPALKDNPWGSHQFPTLRRLPDGRLAIAYHLVNDSCEDYGLEKGWKISSDDGKTWQDVTSEELPSIKACFGTRLPSGKYISPIVHRPYPIDDELHAALSKRIGIKMGALGVEDIPDLFPKTWTFAVASPEDREAVTFDCDLDFPGMTIGLCKGAIIRPMMFGSMKVAPDGSLWASHYARGRNPKNMGYTNYYACYYFRSTDEGKSFHLKSWIQYLPDTEECDFAFRAEGFCEPDFCFMPDGSMITLLRLDSNAPSYIARSVDGGSTWSKPQKFDRCGVLPQLLCLDCGVTLASYGRPGLFVRATDDPSGMIWEDPVELMPFDRQRITSNSCSYTSMVPLDDRSALLAYSNFRIQDESGTERKCIMVRTVRVE